MTSEGTVIAARFVLEAAIGRGGMGRVYRALDRRTGRVVAVKVMIHADPASHDFARFASESAALSELAHPGIVGYVAHGTTDDGLPFLAMEHLDGEDLAARLARAPLSVAESLSVARCAAAALAEAHRRGIIHRDVKPPNLFLRDRSPERVVILDFGIARRTGGARGLTATDAIVGTPHFMAPEQAQSSRDIGPPADVFALGCVLYACLAGRSPFVGDSLMATLAKILLLTPKPLSELRADVSEALSALVARMLAKAPEQRFADGAALLDALSALDATPSGGPPPTPPAGLGLSEMELVSVILVAPAHATAHEPTLQVAQIASDDHDARALQRELAQRGVGVEHLADGSMVASLSVAGESAVDQAVQAAECARLVKRRRPGALVAIATARREAGAGGAVGVALERASGLLLRAEGEVSNSSILLDEVTAGLLAGRVRTLEGARGLIALHDESAPLDASRLLLGKPTPCVGREQELNTLEALVASSLDEGSARAALVVAPPGMGKSRLRHELLRRLDERGDPERALMRLDARCEWMRAGSPYGVIAQTLRRVFEVRAEDRPEVARERVLAFVAAAMPATEALGVAEMLGEVCDAPFSDDASVRLRAARQDPRLMATRIGEAFVSLLRALSSRRAVLLVLEDLHWGDRASVELVALALREIEDRPLCVVAFARPEIHETFPGMWKGRVVEIPLRPLSRRACERLVDRVAGERLDAATAARVVQQSAGNALYLEELLRAACDGKSDTLPETMLAMLQARVGRFDTAERRVLRAASILGETFSDDAVLAVLGPSVTHETLRGTLLELARHEVVEEVRGTGAHRFRHGLMRDAAYGLLTEADRRLGHRLAADWLAAHERDPGPIAEHYRHAGENAQAIPWFVRAAERAESRDDFVATGQFVERGIACGATGAARGALLAVTAFHAFMEWKWDVAIRASIECLELVSPGSAASARSIRGLAAVHAYRNDLDALRACAERWLTIEPDPDARLIFGESGLHIASAAAAVGLIPLTRALIARSEEAFGDELPRYPAIEAWLDMIRSTYHRNSDDDVAAQLRLLRAGVRLYEEVGAPPSMLVLARDSLGEVLCRAGAVDEGLAMLRASLASAQTITVSYFRSHAAVALANALAGCAEPERHVEAESLARSLLATKGISAGYEAMARDVLAQTCAARGDLVEAESEARRAIALSPHLPVRRWQMVAHLGNVLVAAGRADEARELTERALGELDASGAGGYAEAPLLRSASAARRALGDAAVATLLEARADARTLATLP